MNLKDTYNLIAEDWMKDHEHDEWWIEGTKKFISYLKPGGKVLDVGCAGGLKTEFIVSRGFEVTGIDISDKMIKIAKKRVPEAQFFVMDVSDVGQLPQTFDGVFAQAILLHIPKKDALQVMGKLASKLNPSGYFYVAVKEPWEGTPQEEVVKENDYGYDYERFFSYYTLDEIKNLFEQLNMKIIFEDSRHHAKTVWVQVIGQKV